MVSGVQERETEAEGACYYSGGEDVNWLIRHDGIRYGFIKYNGGWFDRSHDHLAGISCR